MNKKLLYGLMIPLLAVVLVSASLLTYYGYFQQEINVNQPIWTTGDLTSSVDCEAGFTCDGTEITIGNDGTKKVNVLVEDATQEDGITTSYIGNLELTKKTVDFTKDKWEVIDGKVQIEYTIVGIEFSAEVTDNPQSGYVLIYYKDNSNRFNEPAEAILVEGNNFPYLPYNADKNSEFADEYDYCSTGEYLTCHGAKIWYVPSDAINGDKTLDWSRASEFYFESELIQYNSNGVLTIYPYWSLELTPEYELDALLEEGSYIINTTVNPIA